MDSQPVLSVAIVGAGIAGLTATIALQGKPGIDVRIYERTKELREVGATIALGPNGLRTLERLGINNALNDSIAFRNKSGHPMIYRHAQTNETVSVDSHAGHIEPRHRTARFFRPHLQRALLQHVDPARLHLGKAFSAVEPTQDGSRVVLSFADGTTAEADVVLGADGIHSAVRRAFVPESRARWTGWVVFRSVFPRSVVAHIPDLPDEAVHYWGVDRTLFLSPLAGGGGGGEDLFAIVASTQCDPEAAGDGQDPVWNREGSLEEVQELYKDWHPTLRAIIQANPHTRVYHNAAADGLDSWVLGGGRVTLAGDAAHAHGGAFAAGGSLAIDDAWAFAQSILHVFAGEVSPASVVVDAGGSARWVSPTPPLQPKQKGDKVAAALRLYERTRKQHTDRVQKTVANKNEATLQRLRTGVVETDQELRRRMRTRQDLAWIHEHDVVSAFIKAVGSSEEQQASRL
ncbi:hypothetical protein PpBr36_06921 [Pyricularia pennisetigena]|uniref:hypothetical protein n=1 Tax=Pyricularia pennisetigena TaxID=1578925 RepID=UPI0011531BD9|nr:hypothetical protein PpBr36_06921 [Pyricularia pennisetigena]TLS24978.1 hypothetical protein PpBr36_06921 [Pyricularia pennisetigena]